MAAHALAATDAARSTLAAAIALKPAIIAARDEMERERRLPMHLVDALKAAGVFRMTMPRAWGGTELDPISQLRIIEELSAADGSVGWCVMVGCDSGYFSAFLDQEVARRMYPDIDMVTGSSTGKPAGRARRVPGGYQVSGRFRFSSGCQHSSWIVAGCVVHDGDTPLVNDNGIPRTLCVFVPIDQCEILDTWHTTGLRGSGSHDFTIAETFVPEERTFSFQTVTSHRPGTLYAWTRLYHLKAGTVPIGIARAAIEATVEIARRSNARAVIKGGRLVPDHALAEESYIQTAIARAEAMTGSARSYLFDVAAEIWDTLLAGGTITHPIRARLLLALTNAYTQCREAVDLLYHVAGGVAVYSSAPLDRMLRDIHTIGQHVIVSPMSYEVAGRVMLGLDPLEWLV
ncbi:MAG TPA: acyl-CoA dehydrogenase family protein [Candidatus Binataceae bacterium]|nr:acyl-CoA dehydrogenase family protein [Candidatus Binataceae bacterium]